MQVWPCPYRPKIDVWGHFFRHLLQSAICLDCKQQYTTPMGAVLEDFPQYSGILCSCCEREGKVRNSKKKYQLGTCRLSPWYIHLDYFTYTVHEDWRLMESQVIMKDIIGGSEVLCSWSESKTVSFIWITILKNICADVHAEYRNIVTTDVCAICFLYRL